MVRVRKRLSPYSFVYRMASAEGTSDINVRRSGESEINLGPEIDVLVSLSDVID